MYCTAASVTIEMRICLNHHMTVGGEPMTFAYLRQRAGISQRLLAIAMNVSVRTVTQWETGEQKPRLFPEQTQTLLEALNCTLDELVQAFSND